MDKAAAVVLDIASLAQPLDRSSGSPKMTVSSMPFFNSKIFHFISVVFHAYMTNYLLFSWLAFREHYLGNGLTEQNGGLVLKTKTLMNQQRNFR
jgi:hypothetical protein